MIKRFRKLKKKFMKKEELPDSIIQNVESLKKTDKDMNNKTHPPKNEQIKMRCLWVFEAFTSNYLENLIEGIKRLGISNYLNATSIIDDIINSNSHNKGCIDLGYIYPPDHILSSMYASLKLPVGVEHIKASILLSVPSVRILALQFVFDEETSLSIDRPLRTKYSSFAVNGHKENYYQFKTAVIQKCESFQVAKNEIHLRCYTWIKENFCGFYSVNQKLKLNFPICELITFERDSPFPKKVTIGIQNYKSVIWSKVNCNKWRNNDMTLLVPSDYSLNKSNLILTGTTCNLTKDSVSNAELCKRFSYYDMILGIWVYSYFVDSYIFILNILQSQIVNISIEKVKNSFIQLQNINNSLMKIGRELPYLISEVDKIPATLLQSNFYKEDINNKNGINFSDYMCHLLQKRMHTLKDDYINIQQTYNITSQLISTHINEKITNKNLRLQYVMLIISLIMLVVTLKNI